MIHEKLYKFYGNEDIEVDVWIKLLGEMRKKMNVLDDFTFAEKYERRFS